MPVKVLVVDDDVNICELLNLYLTKEGYQVQVAHNGVKALEMFSDVRPDIVILDIMMPGIDGLQVCRNIRNIADVPIIMLTAKGEMFDKIMGLELGADDYMVKPFDPKELIARIKAILRRCSTTDKEINTVVQLDGLKVDIGNYELTVNDEKVETPPKELELLYYFVSNPNKVFTRDQLLNEVWGYDFYGDTRTVDVHVKRIREKIDGASDQWELKTVWGVGYKFESKI